MTTDRKTLAVVRDTNGDEIHRAEYPSESAAIAAAVNVCRGRRGVTAAKLAERKHIGFRPDGGIWICDIA